MRTIDKAGAIILMLTILVVPASAQLTNNGATIIVEGAVVDEVILGPSATTILVTNLQADGTFAIGAPGAGFVAATVTQDGHAALMADAVFANGAQSNRVAATVGWEDSAVNNTSGSLAYEYAYSITPPVLRLADYAGLPDAVGNAPEVSFFIAIRANGTTVFESGAVLQGGKLGFTLTETGTSLNPRLTPDPLPPATSVFGYDFDPISGVLTLGALEPGESLTVDFEITVAVDTPGFEAGGLAGIGDPANLEGTPGFAGQFFENGVVATENMTWGNVKAAYRD